MKIYACPKKIEARYQTIIETYRRKYSKKVPKNKQYWTLCATQVNESGHLLEGSELDQIVEAGLITQSQFHGVDRDADIIKMNKKFLKMANWYHDDFYPALSKASAFNPAIVNCDLLEGPKTGAYSIGQVLNLITSRDINNVMVIANLILKSRFTADIGVDAIVTHLNKNSLFRSAFSRGRWINEPSVYCYDGTGLRSKTIMGSIIFYR